MNITSIITSIAAIGALAALLPIAATPNDSAASTAAAYADAPVVLTGADLPTLAGNAPGTIVAWRYSGSWQQIPVQIDERAVVDYATIYKNSAMTGVTALVYTDATTWTGADANATFDTNDELVFMARDAGQRPAVWADPPHVVAGTAREVRVSDPLDAQNTTYVYLFEQDGTLDQTAGSSYVSYSFALNGGAYKSVYTNPMASTGPNPESSTVVGQTYQTHFTDRWVNDELRLTGTNGTSADLLDRHKVLFAPGNCGRSENTFSNGVSPYPIGAFIANKSGPVRAIRSYVGANSGPLTQRDHLFYGQHQEMRTALRVHSVPGIMDFFDWSDQAVGMTYANSNNTAGVTVDGVEETITAGNLAWAMISGTPGSIVESYAVGSDIAGLQPTSYYLDDTTPSTTQCTGDSKAIGSAGVWINQSIPCTDPLPASFGGTCPSSYKTLKLRRSMHYSGQSTTAGAAADYATADAQPPSASVGAWVAPTMTPTITPKTPTITPETPTITPKTPTITPETPTITPETPTITPKTPTITPETPTITPETPTITPSVTTTPTVAPQPAAHSIYLPLIIAP